MDLRDLWREVVGVSDDLRECEACGSEINGQWAVKDGKYWHPECYPHDPPEKSMVKDGVEVNQSRRVGR